MLFSSKLGVILRALPSADISDKNGILQKFTHLAYFSVADHFYKRRYVFLDEALTWDTAYKKCRAYRNGYLAAAKNDEEFDFLRGMYDVYRALGGNAIGVWIDGKYDNVTNEWRCYSYYNLYSSGLYYYDPCWNDMPWSHGEPNRNDTEHCLLVWYSRRDGVANYRCNEKMPAICATFR